MITIDPTRVRQRYTPDSVASSTASCTAFGQRAPPAGDLDPDSRLGLENLHHIEARADHKLMHNSRRTANAMLTAGRLLESGDDPERQSIPVLSGEANETGRRHAHHQRCKSKCAAPDWLHRRRSGQNRGKNVISLGRPAPGLGSSSPCRRFTNRRIYLGRPGDFRRFSPASSSERGSVGPSALTFFRRDHALVL
jgi:hypothetical protein